MEDSDDEYQPPNKQKSGKSLRTYTCRKCLIEFPQRKLLEDHNKINHQKDGSASDVNTTHFKYDEKQEVYICNICSAEFQDKSETQQHFKKNHLDRFCCDQCNITFDNAYAFSCHNQQHNTDQLFCCPFCSYSTKRRTCILTHINRMHYHKFYYYCKTCGKGFNDLTIFKEHDNEHLGIKPFVCVVCDKSFVFSRYLNFHQIRYHTVSIEGQIKENQCPICLKSFAKQTTLVKHLSTRHSKSDGPRERRHLCDVCGKRFATKDKYSIHYRIHTGVKPYTCKYCPKSFIKKDYLIMHERVHTGEKPYSCQHCGKCFNQAAPLRIHIRGHTGERPYVCNFCNAGFTSKGALDIHRKVCTGSVS